MKKLFAALLSFALVAGPTITTHAASDNTVTPSYNPGGWVG